jgi:hypothetical protein
MYAAPARLVEGLFGWVVICSEKLLQTVRIWCLDAPIRSWPLVRSDPESSSFCSPRLRCLMSSVIRTGQAPISMFNSFRRYVLLGFLAPGLGDTPSVPFYNAY